MFSLASVITLSGWRRQSQGRRGERAYFLVKRIVTALFVYLGTSQRPWVLHIDIIKIKKGEEKSLKLFPLSSLSNRMSSKSHDLGLRKKKEGTADMSQGDFTPQTITPKEVA